MSNEPIVLKCEILLDRIFFPKNKSVVESNSFAIFQASVIKNIEACPLKKIKLKGNVPRLEYGEKYKVECVLAEHHEQYGDTYQIQYMNKIIDLSSPEKQKKFLKGFLSDNVVESIFSVYDDVIPLLEKHDIESLCKIKGIKETKAQKIIDEYEDSKDYSSMFMELSDYGLTDTMLRKLREHYKSPDIIVDVIKNNPYDLVNVEGIGFKTADNIAIKGGMSYTDPLRAKGFILNFLTDEGEIGRSYVSYSDILTAIYDTLEGITDEAIQKAAQLLIDQKSIIVTDDGEYVALRKYYMLEKGIKEELIRLHVGNVEIVEQEDVEPFSFDEDDPFGGTFNNPYNKNDYSVKKFSYDGWQEKVKEIEEQQGFDFTDEQLQGIEKSVNNNVVCITGGAGCVDCDTEYFNGREWKKMSDYEMGEKVLQYNENGSAELVYPINYIKQKADYLWHFETKYGLNQTLSDNHNVYYITSKGNLYHKTMKEVRENHEKTAFKGLFITTFDYCGSGINLSDDEIRLMVAVFADGSFNYQTWSDDTYTKARFHLKKNRKKHRLEQLLNALKCEYLKTISSAEGYHDYYVKVPFRCKHFPVEWYNCNKHQMEIIADELVNWDCEYKKKNRFSTTSKTDADFIQFVFTSLGYRTTITANNRVGQQYITCNKLYERKSIEYSVLWSKNTLISMCCDKRKDHLKTPIEKVKTVDGYEYCFTVPSHMLILRRKDRIFITGNCGKTSTALAISKLNSTMSIIQCALSGKAALRISEVTGLPAATIHKTLGWNPETHRFMHNEYEKLEADMVIIDEATMINGSLFLALLKAIPTGAKVIIMGDVQQLTPIGNCQVFADILNSDVLPIVRLTKPHRQAMRSGIIPTSMSIAHQEQIFNNHYEGNKILGELQDMELDIRKDKLLIKDLIISHFKTELEKNDKEITEVQVCIAKRVQGDLSCYSINNAIQEIYNPKFVQGNEIVIYMGKTSEGEKLEYHIRRNDKVINIKNNYDVKSIDNTSVSVFNGNIGIVKNIKDDGEAIIDFIGLGEVVFTANDCKNLELAYACTTHKLQGSQFKSVIVGIDNSSYIMNNAEWLYTAITRAQKYCVLVGQTGAVRKAIHTKEVNNKQTFLTVLLNNQM